MFQVDNTSFDFEVLEFENTPTEAEVEEFQKTHEDNIEEYYKHHALEFRSLPRARFIRMAYAQTGGTESALGMQEAENLRMVAIQKGVDAALEECRKDARYGCSILNDASNLHEVERSDDVAWAFRLPYGGVSDLIRTPVQTEIWILQEIIAPKTYDWNDASARKYIVEKVMHDSYPAPHILESVKASLETLELDLQSIAQKFGGQYSHHHASFLELEQQNVLHSNKLLEFLREMVPAEVGLYSNPIMDHGKMYILHVLQMTAPEDFATRRDAWIERKSVDPNYGLVNAWLQKNGVGSAAVNLPPIQSKYGTLQPNGTIRK